MKLPSLKIGTTSRVELTTTNPTQYLLNVTLLPVDIHVNVTADVVLPNTVLQLTPKDDTGDIVDFDSSASKFNDDPKFVFAYETLFFTNVFDSFQCNLISARQQIGNLPVCHSHQDGN